MTGHQMVVPQFELFDRDVAFLAIAVGTLGVLHDLKAAGNGLDRGQLPALGLDHDRHAAPAAFRAPQLLVPILDHPASRGSESRPSFVVRAAASFRYSAACFSSWALRSGLGSSAANRSNW